MLSHGVIDNFLLLSRVYHLAFQLKLGVILSNEVHKYLTWFLCELNLLRERCYLGQRDTLEHNTKKKLIHRACLTFLSGCLTFAKGTREWAKFKFSYGSWSFRSILWSWSPNISSRGVLCTLWDFSGLFFEAWFDQPKILAFSWFGFFYSPLRSWVLFASECISNARCQLAWKSCYLLSFAHVVFWLALGRLSACTGRNHASPSHGLDTN